MKAIYQQMALYNQWINKKIYSAAAELNYELLSEDRGAYFGSIMGTLNHILVGDIFWFKRFSDHSSDLPSLEYFRLLKRPDSLDMILHDELSDLWLARKQADAVILQFTSDLTDEIIGSTLRYKNSKDQEFNKNMGYLLLHVFNHQTHHRGQASTLLCQAGIDIGVTDMVVGIPNQ
jgi:uncharacterized damage-inducible protein DinB